MAENWHEVREALAGQEEYFEWRCRVCEENDLIKKATSYCKNCDECLCSSCLKSHSRYNKTHKVLGEKEKVEWGKTELGQDTGIECTEHPGQTVSMYCGQHDDLCCPVCAVLKHTDTCKPNMTYIPQVAKGIMNGDEFKAVINSNDSLIASLTRLIEERTKLQVKLSASREECTRRIEGLHRELAQHLEKLKEDSLSEMNNKHDAEEQNIEEDIERCSDLKKDLCEMKQQLNPTGSVNESLVFVKMKKSKTNLATFEDTVQYIDAAERLTFELNPNSSLHDTVTSALKLGDCAGVYQQPKTTLHKGFEIPPMTTAYDEKVQSLAASFRNFAQDYNQKQAVTALEELMAVRNSRDRQDRGRNEDRSYLTRDDSRQDWGRNEDRSNLTREDSAQRGDSRRGDRYPDSHQLFVGNLPHSVQERELKDFFQAFGNVVQLRINTNIGSGKIPNFGFVVFDSPEAVQTVVKNKPIIFKEHRLNIEEKKSKGRPARREKKVKNGGHSFF